MSSTYTLPAHLLADGDEFQPPHGGWYTVQRAVDGTRTCPPSRRSDADPIPVPTTGTVLVCKRLDLRTYTLLLVSDPISADQLKAVFGGDFPGDFLNACPPAAPGETVAYLTCMHNPPDAASAVAAHLALLDVHLFSAVLFYDCDTHGPEQRINVDVRGAR